MEGAITVVVIGIGVGAVALPFLVAFVTRKKQSGQDNFGKCNPQAAWPNPPSAGCGVSEGWVEQRTVLCFVRKS